MYPERFVPSARHHCRRLQLLDEVEPVHRQNDKLEVLTHQRSLDKHLATILGDVENRDFGDLERTILAMQDDAAGINAYLSKTLEAKYYAQYRPAESTAAAKALAIPELLENVLSNLKAVDLMQCYQVNTAFRDVIERSDVLQMLLFLKPDKTGNGTTFPFHSTCISCAFVSQNYQTMSFKAVPGLGTGLPSIGSRWKKMLISQPPIHHIYYGLYCEIDECTKLLHDGYGHNDGQRVGGHLLTLQSDGGLTIGDLYEAAEAMFKTWSGCTQGTFAPGGDKSGHEVVFDTSVYR